MARLSTRLEALVDAVLTSKLYGSVKVDLSRSLKLALVSNKVDADVFGGVLLDLFEPRAQILEGLVARNVIRQEDAMCATVKDPRH